MPETSCSHASGPKQPFDRRLLALKEDATTDGGYYRHRATTWCGFSRAAAAHAYSKGREKTFPSPSFKPEDDELPGSVVMDACRVVVPVVLVVLVVVAAPLSPCLLRWSSAGCAARLPRSGSWFRAADSSVPGEEENGPPERGTDHRGAESGRHGAVYRCVRVLGDSRALLSQ
ncbi:hypothetical protein EYF80_036248 [Liparis tanakae]|uniref:Uncharacterized protein n=1 Tax=Liparis tanakae TaxID=230148 RepID=A0A4Z2GJ25_9TELE|nr:hypothetical protein EYF80_036248 [Liparis tanakae]